MTNERTLFDRIKNADELAFEELFIAYGKKVYLFANSYIKNKADAEDIMQNVFLKIWQNRASLDGSKSPNGYIFTIAYNLAIDLIRERGVKELVELKELDQVKLADRNSPEDFIVQRQLASLYETALNSLPPKRREVFILSRHQGLSNKEIAASLNISVKTVENQMTSALASLRDYFSDQQIDAALLFLLFFYLA